MASLAKRTIAARLTTGGRPSMSLPLPYDDDLDIDGTDPPDGDEAEDEANAAIDAAIDSTFDSFDDLEPAEDPEAEGEIDSPGPVDD